MKRTSQERLSDITDQELKAAIADRYERKSLLITSNLSFSDWGKIFQGERMTAALLDRLTHHCENES